MAGSAVRAGADRDLEAVVLSCGSLEAWVFPSTAAT